jgi:hypothetical protein
METLKAQVDMVAEKHFLAIGEGDDEIRMPLSDDDPNAVKAAFNKLLLRIKNGEVKIKLEGGGADLFSQVAKEYVIQLNREIIEVRREMVRLGLTE